MDIAVDEIAADIFRISYYPADVGFTFNQYLVRDEEPLLYHTGFRKTFRETRDAVATLIDPKALRWIGYSHFEPDECGALNLWLEAAPGAAAIAVRWAPPWSWMILPIDRRAPFKITKLSALGGRASGCFARRTCRMAGMPVFCSRRRKELFSARIFFCTQANSRPSSRATSSVLLVINWFDLLLARSRTVFLTRATPTRHSGGRSAQAAHACDHAWRSV